MNKLNRLKSAIISGAVAMTSLAGPLASVANPSLSATAADSDNYAKLLQYSLYFYDANMCGKMNGDCGLTWRGDCHTNDDVVGGFHDAGDHVWFGQPGGYAASTLGWSYYEFKDAYEATGQGAHLKVITDRFAKFMRDATKLNGNTVSQVLIEKGDGDTDHMYWGAPEKQGSRGRMLWTSGGAANITAEYAAALAANYVNFGNPDDLKYAKALYDFSKKNTNCHNSTFYDGHWTGADDEIDWAAGWLYLATKDSQYLNELKGAGQSYSNHSWESVQLGAGILKGEITGDWSSAGFLNNFKGNNYCFLANWEWGSARQNATAQLCTLVAAKYNKADASWAKNQMMYLTGDKAFANGQKHCLVVGFKSDSSRNPHHRASSPDVDASQQNDGRQNKYLLVGALCGGPVDANGTYKDVRSDYQGNEVALDYNAGFVGAAAGLYHFYKTGSTVSSIEGVSKIYSGSTPSVNVTTQSSYNPPVTTTTKVEPYNPPAGGDIVLYPEDMSMGVDEGTDGGLNNYAEFAPDGAKSATLYLKVNTNDTEVSGGFGTWTGKWEQEEFQGVKVGSDKTVAIDYTIPANVGSTVKAMVWWPHGDGVTIQKVVLHKDGSSVQTTTTKRTTTTTTTRRTTTTTTTTKNQPATVKIYGDANNDGSVDMSDVVLVMQALASPNKYGLNGSERTHITQQGWANADVHRNGNGITTNDALAIQKKLLGLISSLPVDKV